MFKSVLLYILFSFILIGCKPAAEGNVKIKTSGALGAASVEVVGGLERGEFLIGSDTDVITVKVTNNTQYFLSDLSLDLDEDSTAGMKFHTIDGRSVSPGYLGTCGSILNKGDSCTFVISYNPAISGEFYQDISVSYKNLVDSVVENRRLTMLAGEAASLIFTTEEVNYSFGIVERSDRVEYLKTLIIKNTGGLTAKDISFSTTNDPGSSAYVISRNTCKATLVANETCEIDVLFTPLNYDASAPDGNVDLFYYANILIPYVRDPDGGKSSLNAYFSTKSYNIKGKMLVAGLSTINFDSLVVGNYTTESFRVKNDGDKEAILHYLNIKNDSGVIVASCVKVSGDTFLECRDPSLIDTPGSTVSLPSLPYKIEDVDSCITPYDQLDYTRDADGALSNSGVVEVVGKVDELPGGTCLFNIIFHPSTTFTVGGDFNNWTIGLAYDSTWKNLRDLKGTLAGDTSLFSIDSAVYSSAAKLTSDSFEYGGDTSYTNLDTDDNGIYLYDLGRISLISSSAYKQQTKIKFKNSGEDIAQILSIKDGQSTPFVFTGTSQDLNTYYLSASHSGCSIVAPNGGECDVRFQLAPLASNNSDSAAAQNEENANMYDDIPNQKKKFIIEYQDGTTYNDDLTLRANPQLEVHISSKMIRKGFLVFEDTSTEQGVSTDFIAAGNTEFLHVKLKNVGTGSIPYIEAIDGKKLERLVTTTFPYEIVDRAGGEDGADKDCYELINFDDSNQPTSSTPSVGSLNAGENCSLTVRMKLRETDRKLTNDYDNVSPEWERFFNIANDNTSSAWEYDRYFSSVNNILSFRYFDGDGTPDTANGYSPDLENYGNKYTISGGNNGDYKINVRFGEAGKLIPKRPLPSSSAIIIRPAISLPSIPVDGWGNPVNSDFIPMFFHDYSEMTGMPPATHGMFSINHVLGSGMVDNTQDYFYHAGTFNPGAIYDGSIQFESLGDLPVTDVSIISETGDSEITVNLDSNNKLNLTFDDTSLRGFYGKDLTIQYKGGRESLDDEANLVYSDILSTIILRIFVEFDPTPSTLSLSSQDFTVSYDSSSDTTTEVLDGATQNFNLAQTEILSNEVSSFKAIKGSEVYAKKRYTVTNTSSNDITTLDSVIKQSFDSTVSSNVSGGIGYSITSNSCLGVSLNAGASCTIDIVYDASVSEPDSTIRYLILTQETFPNQFVSSGIKLDFASANPADVVVANTNPENINNASGGVIQGSYPINFGFYNDSNHPVLNNSPNQEVTVENITLQNSAVEKASFLLQYRQFVNDMNATVPSGSSIKIYDDNENAVFAVRACFYGDDENDNVLPVDEWGFNADTNSICTLKVVKKFDDEFVGEKLDAKNNNIELSFYNSGRSSTDSLYLHFKGFLEPNRSIVTNTLLSNVVSDDQGDLSFSWDAFTPTNLSWGAITGYRVFYSQTKTALNNIFETTASFEDSSSANISITGLVPGRYYYIRVVAKRTTAGGKEYLSESNMGQIELISPPENTFYDYGLNIVVDKYLSPEGSPRFGDKAEVTDGCADEFEQVVENGISVTKYKKLISSDVFSVISQDSSLSQYSIPGTPHWMSDPVVDIEPIFSPDFSCLDKGGSDSTNSIFYQKSCSDCSCNFLSKIEGGDGENVPPTATVYVDADASAAAQRCYFEL